MAERQIHGFLYEKKCFADFPWWTSNSDEYTNKWDGYDTELEMPVSIKCIQKGSSIDFGDIFRMATIDEDWILQVGFWQGSKTNIVEEYTIEIDKNDWQSLVGDIESFKKAKIEMSSISNDYSDDEKWKQFRLKYKTLWGSTIFQPRFKRDHKKQKRIQCGIMYNDLKEHFNLN